LCVADMDGRFGRATASAMARIMGTSGRG
jgi:hypothetical protein